MSADYVQIVQLFQNLISNAIKYRKPDERPRIEIALAALVVERGESGPGAGDGCNVDCTADEDQGRYGRAVRNYRDRQCLISHTSLPSSASRSLEQDNRIVAKRIDVKQGFRRSGSARTPDGYQLAVTCFAVQDFLRILHGL